MSDVAGTLFRWSVMVDVEPCKIKMLEKFHKIGLLVRVKK
jgi:hypothetical protein